MAKVFNVTAVCIPEEHYMVNIDERLLKIKSLVDGGKYFTINRARQYGKTTTLMALEKVLSKDYDVVFMDFQTFDDAKFANGNVFAHSFAKSFLRLLKSNKSFMTQEMREEIMQFRENMEKYDDFSLKELFECLSDICAISTRGIVLMIDEIDSATNNQVFLDFLSQIRAYYIRRKYSLLFKQ